MSKNSAIRRPGAIQCPLAVLSAPWPSRTHPSSSAPWPASAPWPSNAPLISSTLSGYSAPTGYSALNIFSVLSGYGAPSTVTVPLQVPLPLLVSKSPPGISQNAFAHVQLRIVCAPPYVQVLHVGPNIPHYYRPNLPLFLCSSARKEKVLGVRRAAGVATQHARFESW